MDNYILNYAVSLLSTIATFITVYLGIKQLKSKDITKKGIERSELQIEEYIKGSTVLHIDDIKNENIKGNNHLKKDSKSNFEITTLSEYYGQVLYQSKVSFWFSLIFASIGFTVIIFAAITYTSTNISSSVVSMLAGVIINAISALFFVQSKQAQKSMSDFFNKLRQDRSIIDAKEFCETITNNEIKDSLKVQLALFLTGIQNTKTIGEIILKANNEQKE